MFFALCMHSIFNIAAATNLNTINSIEDLQWKSRIILIYAYDDAKSYAQVLNEQDAHIEERHIHWFILDVNKVYSNYNGALVDDFHKITKQKYFSQNEIAIKLIGKDGYVKASYDTLDLDSIYNLIDSMPMRQMEMHNK